MSQGTWNIDYGPFRGFYRDRENGWIFGVCAGLADRFNLNVGAVRIIAEISLLIFFTVGVFTGSGQFRPGDGGQIEGLF